MSGANIAYAESKMEPLHQIGKWLLVRSTDSMTDEVKCIASHSDEMRIWFQGQFGKSGEMYFTKDGYAYAYRYRIDEMPVSEWMTFGIYRNQGRVYLAGVNFDPLLGAKRIRLEIDGGGSDAFFDVELDGISEALDFILHDDKCR